MSETTTTTTTAPPVSATTTTPTTTTKKSSTKSPTTWLRIIQINDVYELDHFPRLYNLIQDYKKSDNDDKNRTTIVICAGDFVAPSLLSSLDQGKAMIDCLNAIGITHVCLGNHEADIPPSALYQRIYQQSQFIWINTNMPTLERTLLHQYSNDDDNDETSTMKNSDKIQPYCIIPVPSSSSSTTKQVCLLGLLTHDPSLYRPDAFGGATILPIVDVMNQILSSQQQQGLGGNADTTTTAIDDATTESATTTSMLLPPHPIDCFIPLTHQGINDDRIFAQTFGSADSNKIPVVCGGHDHEVYNEIVNHCHIVKAGMDAQNAAIIDIQWFDDSNEDSQQQSQSPPPTVTVPIIPSSHYEPNVDMMQRVAGHQKVLQELERAKLFAISDWMLANHHKHEYLRQQQQQRLAATDAATPNSTTSAELSCSSAPHPPFPVGEFSTVNNRLGPSSGTSAICTMLRMGMRAQCAIINAGAVRGGQVYDPQSHFTWSNLKAEIPFVTGMTALYIPGHVIQDTIRHSRLASRQNPPAASGGYLHTCSNIEFCDNHDEILSIQGRPYDPNSTYLTALPAQFFAGIDNHEPLLQWAADVQQGNNEDEKNTLNKFIDEEAAIPAKMVLVQVFAVSMWLQMGRFDEIDRNHDGVIRRDEVKARLAEICDHDCVTDLMVDNIFSIADMNHDGSITPLEMMICQFVATDILDHVCTQDELRTMKEIAAQVLGEDPTRDEVKVMVEKIRDTVDLRGDGTIDRTEVMQVLGSLQRSELLR